MNKKEREKLIEKIEAVDLMTVEFLTNRNQKHPFFYLGFIIDKLEQKQPNDKLIKELKNAYQRVIINDDVDEYDKFPYYTF